MAKDREYIKITFQDIEIAEQFFQNEKHLNEFLINVVRYYRGQDIQIKTKIVKKYFETYKKTMDYLIGCVKIGYEGYLEKLKKQDIKTVPLEGSVQPSAKPPLEPNINNNKNNKSIIESLLSEISSHQIWLNEKSYLLKSRNEANTLRLLKNWLYEQGSEKLQGRDIEEIKRHFINSIKDKGNAFINPNLGHQIATMY